MVRKYVKQFVMVCMKYFFDMDYLVCGHAFLALPIASCVFKLLAVRIAVEFQYGLLTVKEDAENIKAGFITYKERWDNGSIREALISNTRFFGK
jgi:hypothetical protein